MPCRVRRGTIAFRISRTGSACSNHIAIAVEAAFDAGMLERVAVLDWDVHHGKGTEAIFYDRDDVLTISLHQERNYPYDTGDTGQRGTGAGRGPSTSTCRCRRAVGHTCYLEAMERNRAASADGLRTGRYRGRLRLRRIGGWTRCRA